MSVSISSRWKIFIFIGLWTVLALFAASQNMMILRQIGRNVSWSESIHYALVSWYSWGILTIGLQALVRKFPLNRASWKQTSFVLLAGLVIAPCIHVVSIAVYQFVERWCATVCR